eukprot:CAMPEP_0176498846 /NCGR_PEP_ID=MMETSP0200_2-20121128/12573_1 /TAXON_ID=947934 /ORGANISM="Chaetoceros sp., Strain GSL56" /LENGTH=1279 /DNA_ID=CAMNT_0017897149 /DNA_START=211 /DNA_END=4050 /DNA_ORIENTATION=+
MERHYRGSSSCPTNNGEDCTDTMSSSDLSLEEAILKGERKTITDYFLQQFDFQRRIRQLKNATKHTNLQFMQETITESFPPMPPSRISANIDKIKSMFEHAYDSYMYNAYPASELKPISCKGGVFDLVRLPALTLIDTLDMLLIMENHTEFARSVERLRALDEEMRIKSIWKNGVERGGLFAQDQNVSVFETNIRVLGGLLSAHQMAEIWMEDKVLLENIFGEDGNVLMGMGSVSGDSGSGSGSGSGSSSSTNNDVTNDEEPCQNYENDDNDENSIPPATKSPLCTTQKGNQMQLCSNGDEKLYEEEEKTEDSAHSVESYNYDSGERTSSSIGNNDTSLSDFWVYDGFLLELAHDIGTRLLPAFNTRTGIPYGTINLIHGVPQGETTVASLAGGGTLTLEMELLSRLTKDEKFGKLARLSTRALFSRRSGYDLLGKHIDVADGKWTETLSGIGSNSDSFYEYLIKDYILFPEDEDFFTMFNTTYNGIYFHDKLGDWYPDVAMKDGLLHPHYVFESLAAFYPGMQVLLGEINPAARSTNAFTAVREYAQFLPERFDFAQFEGFLHHRTYPLRPELYESNYFLHLATKDLGYDSGSSWIWNADFFLNELDDSAKTRCGYAAIRDISSLTNRGSSSVYDEMPSFFLSETLKYLYITFNSDNPIDRDKDRSWIFTTEAHPFHSVSAVKTSDSWLEEARSDLLMTLDTLISLNATQTKSTSIPRKKDLSLDYFYSEMWSLYTGKFSHMKDIDRIMANSKLDLKKTSTSRNISIGRLVDIPPNRVEVDAFSTNILNFGFLTHDIHGRGSRISKSCPNYHQSNSLWVQALIGDDIDYAYVFETTFSNGRGLSTIKPKMPSAITASTLLGTSYLSYDSHECRTRSRHADTKKRELKGASHHRSGSKLVDVDDLGTFEVAVSPSGTGYYFKHVTSGESIEMTIVQLENNSREDKKEFVAIDSYILADTDLKGRGNLVNQFKAFLKIKPSSNRAKNRHVVVSDVDGNAYECKVELKYRVSGSMETISTSNFPCLPASYGPSSVEELTSGETLGVQFEAKIYKPISSDPFGCREEWTDNDLRDKMTGISKYDPNALDGEIMCLREEFYDFQPRPRIIEGVCPRPFESPRVQLVNRGMCNFHWKGINMNKQYNAGAIIVVNSDPNDLFIMSGIETENREDIDVDEPLSVLVSGEDGRLIINAIERYAAIGTDVLASIRIFPKPSSSTLTVSPEKAPPSNAIDGVDWPLVVTEQKNIEVYASQGWGIGAIKDDKSNQWQLSLLRHSYGIKTE